MKFLVQDYQPRKFEPVDTTFRDGLQSPLWFDFGRIYPTTDEMTELAKVLMEYGVRFFELFSPTVSRRAEQDLKAILKIRNQMRKQLNQPIFVLVHSGLNESSILAALSEPIDGINLFMGISPVSLKNKHHDEKTIHDVASEAESLIKNVRKKYPNLWIRFSGEDSFRTEIKNQFQIYDRLKKHVNAFGFPDTVGVADPEMVAIRAGKIKRHYPKIYLQGHFQNDRGLALINALKGVHMGVNLIDCSVLGVAERSGLPSLTALVFNLYKESPDLVKGFKIEMSYHINAYWADVMQTQVPWQEPISGTNRSHYAGIHGAAVLRNHETYEAHQLEKFGVSQYNLLLGPLSGRHVVHYYLVNYLNYVNNISLDKLQEITRDFKNRSSKIPKGSSVSPKDLLENIARKYHLKKISKPTTHLEEGLV